MQHETRRGQMYENSVSVNIFMLDYSNSDREEEISMKPFFYEKFHT